MIKQKEVKHFEKDWRTCFEEWSISMAVSISVPLIVFSFLYRLLNFPLGLSLSLCLFGGVNIAYFFGRIV
jgi:hypothetical protein